MNTAHPQKTVSAIVFDVGGVLLKLYPEKSFAAFAAAGAPDFERIWRQDTPHKSLYRFEVGAIDAAQFRREVSEALQASLSDRAFDDAFNAMLGVIEQGTWQLLEVLGQTLPLYVLSNNNVLHLTAIERAYPRFRSLFRDAYFSQEIQARKPDKHAFEQTLVRSGVQAACALFVDDSEANIEAAKSCGMQGLYLPRNSDLRGALRQCLPSTLGV